MQYTIEPKPARVWIGACAAALCLATLFFFSARASYPEVWNDPGGVAVTDTSQDVDLTRAMGSVVIFNDDTTNSIHARIWECGETPAAATTNHLEIKPEKFEAFNHGDYTETALGYCTVSLICSAAGPCPARVHAK